MKRTAILVAAFLVILAPLGLEGQEHSQKVEIRKDDTLWELAGLHLNDPFQWGRLVEANRFLQEPGRVFRRGEMTIALIRPGENLVIPRGMETVVPRLVPFEEIAVRDTIPWLAILLAALALALLAAAIWLLRWRVRTANPATAGPPIIAGGIGPTEPERIRDRFREMAFAHYQRERPTPGLTLDRFQILGEVERGEFHGMAVIRYRDGREERKRFSGEMGYRARVRYPDGREEVLRFLQACANDVWLEGRQYFFEPGFRFVPAALIRVPETAPTTATTEDASTSRGTVTILVADRRLVVPAGTIVRIHGENLTVVQPDGSEIILEPGERGTEVHPLRRASAE